MGIRASISPGGLAALVGLKMVELKKMEKGTRWEIGFIVGRAEGLHGKIDKKTGEVKNALVGTFQGLNTDGEVITEAGECYLPAAVHKMIEGPLHNPDNKAIDFSFKLDAIEDDTSVTGYRYDCIAVGAPAKADPLANLRAGIAEAKVAQIEAPKKAKAKVEATA